MKQMTKARRRAIARAMPRADELDILADKVFDGLDACPDPVFKRALLDKWVSA